MIAAVPAAGSDYKPKVLSRFEVAEGIRNPFWPCNYRPKAASAANVLGGIKAGDFVLTSILLGAAPRMALINGRDYAEGDFVSVGRPQQQIKVRLITIFDGGVILQHGNEKITVPLRRL